MVEQPEHLVEPLPTPSFPAESLAFLCSHHVPPDFLFYPVLDKRKTPTGVPYRKVVHPAPQDRVDPFDHLTYRVALVPPEDLPELRQYRRSLFQLRRVLRCWNSFARTVPSAAAIPISRRAGSCVNRFEACSAFTARYGLHARQVT